MLGLIFLKNFFAASAALLCIGVFYSCSDNSRSSFDDAPQMSSVDEVITEEIVTEPETQPITEIKLATADGTYIYDNAGVLTGEAFTNCNDYAGWLYKERLINAAVVTTNDLGGKTPYEFAEAAYEEIYAGKGSGFLLLINNDTNNDYIYKTGSCSVYVSSESEKQEFYWATRELVNEDYEGAVLRLLKLAVNCPSHLFDNAGVFTAEKGAELDSIISACDTQLSVLVTENSTGSTNEELLQMYFDRRYGSESGIMLLVDTASKTVTAVSDSELPQRLSAVLDKTNAYAAKSDYEAAIITITDAMGAAAAESAATSAN